MFIYKTAISSAADCFLRRSVAVAVVVGDGVYHAANERSLSCARRGRWSVFEALSAHAQSFLLNSRDKKRQISLLSLNRSGMERK